MPEIGNLKYGYSKSGVKDYLNTIHSDVIKEAAKKVKDIDDIKKVCNEHWSGKAKDNFLKNLQKDANHVAEEYEKLYNALENEVEAVRASMAKKDDTLIN